jgi:hypothetical protein
MILSAALRSAAQLFARSGRAGSKRPRLAGRVGGPLVLLRQLFAFLRPSVRTDGHSPFEIRTDEKPRPSWLAGGGVHSRKVAPWVTAAESLSVASPVRRDGRSELRAFTRCAASPSTDLLYLGGVTYMVLGADLSAMWETFQGDNRKKTATNAVAPITARAVFG